MRAERARSSPVDATQSRADRLLALLSALDRCQRQLRALLGKYLEPSSLSDTGFFVLWLCDRVADPGVPQQDLVAATDVSSAQMSGLVEQLRRRGLLQAHRGQPDRRQQYWRLTDAGRCLLNQLRTALAGASRPLQDAITGEDEVRLQALLQRLRVTGETAPTLTIFACDAAPSEEHTLEQGGTS